MANSLMKKTHLIQTSLVKRSLNQVRFLNQQAV